MHMLAPESIIQKIATLTQFLESVTHLCEEDGEPLKQLKLNIAIIFQHMFIPLMVVDSSDMTSLKPAHGV